MAMSPAERGRLGGLARAGKYTGKQKGGIPRKSGGGTIGGKVQNYSPTADMRKFRDRKTVRKLKRIQKRIMDIEAHKPKIGSKSSKLRGQRLRKYLKLSERLVKKYPKFVSKTLSSNNPPFVIKGGK